MTRERAAGADAVGRCTGKATLVVEHESDKHELGELELDEYGSDKHGPDLQGIFYDWNGTAGASGKQKFDACEAKLVSWDRGWGRLAGVSQGFSWGVAWRQI
ncbi:MAG: hypothetical protein WBF04_02030 [Candidatus Sulfotelmatobacter sp.]